MARKNQRIQVTWNDELQKCAEIIVEKYSAEMVKLGIPSQVASGAKGEITINRSGAIAFALMQCCKEIGE